MKLNNLFTDTGVVGTVLQYTTALLLLVIVQLAGMSEYRGWWTWLAQLPALAIISATAVARVYDISARSKRWFVRRMGFILTGISCLGMAIAPIMSDTTAFPSWKSVVLVYGLSLVWLTTPGQPPWWKYISSRDKVTTVAEHQNDRT